MASPSASDMVALIVEQYLAYYETFRHPDDARRLGHQLSAFAERVKAQPGVSTARLRNRSFLFFVKRYADREIPHVFLVHDASSTDGVETDWDFEYLEDRQIQAEIKAATGVERARLTSHWYTAALR